MSSSASADDNGSLLGLGFGQNTSLENGSVEELMQHYLQQCLEFHHEQEQQQQQQQQQLHQVVGRSSSNYNHNVSSSIKKDDNGCVDAMSIHQSDEEETTFVASMHSEEELLKPSALDLSTPALALKSLDSAVSKAKTAIQSFPVAPPSSSSTTTSALLSDSLAAAMAKAKEVVQKFQRQRPPDEQICSLDTCSTRFLSTVEELSPHEYKSRRLAFFVTENDRLERAMCQNFDYLARKEAQRLQQQLQQIEATKQLERTMMVHQQKQHEQRVKALQKNHNSNINYCAGIGTNQQRTVSRKRKTAQDENGTITPSTTTKKTKKKSTHEESAASLYVCNIPITMLPQEHDGSPGFLHQLFSSYGNIRKMHFYRNKETGMFKGDALVVYDFPAVNSDQKNMNDARAFLQSICTQMNGCELPCGSILTVEPATKCYEQKDGFNAATQQASPSHKGPTSGSSTMHHKESSNGETVSSQILLEKGSTVESHEVSHEKEYRGETDARGEEDEDLDDFFASLT